jgi:hypothetical protein
MGGSSKWALESGDLPRHYVTLLDHSLSGSNVLITRWAGNARFDGDRLLGMPIAVLGAAPQHPWL